MNLTWIRLSFAFLWFVIGLGLVFRDHLFPAMGVQEDANANWTLAGILALLFAGWNLFRVYLARKPRTSAPTSRPIASGMPLQPRLDPAQPRPVEYIPELDFFKHPPTPKPPQ